MKFIKYTGYTILISVSILLLIQIFVTFNSYKNFITAKFEQNSGGKIIINGDVKLQFIPNFGVNITKVELKESYMIDSKPLVTIDKICVNIEILKLLLGKLRISSINIDHPNIRLIKFANGTKNLDLLVQNYDNLKTKKNVVIEKNSITSNKLSSLNETKLFIKNIIIKDAAVYYFDREIERKIDNLNLRVILSPNMDQADISSQLILFDQNYYIVGKIQFQQPKNYKIDLNLKSINELLSLNGIYNLELKSFEGKINSQDLINQLRCNSEYKTLKTIKFDSDILVNSQKISLNNIAINSDDFKFSGISSFDFNTQEIRLKSLISYPQNVNLNIIGNLAKNIYQININYKIIDKILQIFKLTDPLIIRNLNQQTHAIADLKLADNQIIIDKFKFLLGKANFEGKINITNYENFFYFINNIIDKSKKMEIAKNNWNINIDCIGKNFSDLLVQNNLATLKKLENFHLNFQIFNNNLNNLKVVWNDSRIGLNNDIISTKGNANINLQDQKPNINLNLEIVKLDLDKIFASNLTIASSAAKLSNNVNHNSNLTVSQNFIWSQDKIEFSFLEHLNGNLNCIINNLKIKSLNFNNFQAKLNLNNNKIILNSLVSNLYNGTLKASGELLVKDNHAFNIKLNLQNAELKNINYNYNDIKLIKGLFNCSLNAKSFGTTIREYVNNINGNFDFNSENGTINGLNLSKIVDSLKHIKNIDSTLNLLNNSFKNGQTNFKKFQGQADIKSGQAQLNNCVVQAEDLVVEVKGIIDLPKFILNLKTIIDVGIKNIPRFSCLFFGPINKFKYELDFAELQKYLMKKIVNGVVDSIKSGDGKNILKKIIGNNNSSQENSNQDSSNHQINNLIEEGLNKLFSQ